MHDILPHVVTWPYRCQCDLRAYKGHIAQHRGRRARAAVESIEKRQVSRRHVSTPRL
jgi:hypothetical protein